MKNFKTLIIVIFVGGLAFTAYYLSQKDDSNKIASEALSDFAVQDTASIDKLIITDTEGNPGVTLVRDEYVWTMEDGACIQQHLVHTILETIRHITVKSPISEGEVETINKSLTAHHKKVEIFVKGKLSKTWYVGDPTMDQYGTYMLLKDPEKGKSPEPFVTYMPNMYGNLESRFITNPLEFQCTGIFNYDPLEIKSIEVLQPENPKMSFKIVAEGENLFKLFSNNEPVPVFDTTQVRGYILHFKKIHFERHNYLITKEQEDSVMQTQPMYTFEVITKAGDKNFVKCYKKGMMYEKYDFDGQLIEWDRDRLWLELNDGSFVVGQYHVFDKLLKGLDFFTPVESTQSENLDS